MDLGRINERRDEMINYNMNDEKFCLSSQLEAQKANASLFKIHHRSFLIQDDGKYYYSANLQGIEHLNGNPIKKSFQARAERSCKVRLFYTTRCDLHLLGT